MFGKYGIIMNLIIFNLNSEEKIEETLTRPVSALYRDDSSLSAKVLYGDSCTCFSTKVLHDDSCTCFSTKVLHGDSCSCFSTKVLHDNSCTCFSTKVLRDDSCLRTNGTSHTQNRWRSSNTSYRSLNMSGIL